MISDNDTAEKTQVPPPKSDNVVNIDRIIHDIPKARRVDNKIEYYIIYADQINLKIGQYVPETELTKTEKEYVHQNSDKIRFMRKKTKTFSDMYAIEQTKSKVPEPTRVTTTPRNECSIA
jgi:hypothetical protein